MKPSLISLAVTALTLAVPSASSAASSKKLNLDSAIGRAISFCEAVASREGSGFPVPVGADVHDATPPALGTPDLVKRFAATQQSGRMTSPAFFVQFRSSDGLVWAVVYEGMPACDFMITGADGDMPAMASRLSANLSERKGWQIMASAPATAAMPLAQHLLVKKMPKAGAPEFGIRLRIRALAGEAADKDGVQMEMSFLSGEIGSASAPAQ